MKLKKSSGQNTINNKLAAIKSLFSFGVKTGYLSANPASMIRTTLAKDALNERILQAEEVKQLIDAVANERDRSSLVLKRLLVSLAELISLGLKAKVLHHAR